MLELLEQLREDLAIHDGKWGRPGFQAIALHRFGTWGRQQPPPLRIAAQLIHKLFFPLVRNLYGIEIPLSVKLGRRVKISHQSGIVINGGAVIGEGCRLRHNVTIGSLGNVVGRERQGAPKLEQDVYVGVGAVIIGKITVGARARIGANATVVSDVPPDATVVPQPSQVRVRSPRPSKGREP